jgi:hypothetical protein
MIRQGRCLHCDTLIWRSAWQPNSPEPLLLWPMPDSVYAGIRHRSVDSLGRATVSAIAVGIGFCGPDAPRVGDVPHPNLAADLPGAIEVVEVETAKERYAHWFTPGFGEWLRAHARDYLKMDGVAIDKLMEQWKGDCTWVG